MPSQSFIAATIRAALRVACPLALALAVVAPASQAFAGSVFLDPGHGGRYPGAVYAGVEEQRVNLLIALETRKVLEARGHRVGISRTRDANVGTADIPTWHYNETTDSFGFYSDGITGAYPVPYDDLQARCNKANLFGADIFISIHNNAGGTATGTETYYNNWGTPSDTRLSANLATLLQGEVTAHAGTKYRKVDDVGYYVVRWTNMPSALVEVAFLSNSSDRAKLLSASFRHSVAVGIADAVDRFFASRPFKPLEPRIAGLTRYATSSAAALSGWPDGAQTVILASGEDWADALSASPLSTRLDAPVLLTPRESLTASTAAAIATLGPANVIVLGGEAAVASSVAEAARQAAGVPAEAVQRIAGADRYETAALVAERVGLQPGAGVTIVAGTAFPDATSASAFSGMLGMPILLTRTDSLPAPTAAFLAAHSEELTRAVVVGGPAVVSTPVVLRLRESLTVSWLYGPDRYQTNVAVLRRFWPSGSMTPVVATAVDFPDALTAGAYGAHGGQPVVLCGSKYLAPKTREWVMLNNRRIPGFTMVGGTGVLSNVLEWELDKARRFPAPASP